MYRQVRIAPDRPKGTEHSESIKGALGGKEGGTLKLPGPNEYQEILLSRVA